MTDFGTAANIVFCIHILAVNLYTTRFNTHINFSNMRSSHNKTTASCCTLAIVDSFSANSIIVLMRRNNINTVVTMNMTTNINTRKNNDGGIGEYFYTPGVFYQDAHLSHLYIISNISHILSLTSFHISYLLFIFRTPHSTLFYL